MIYPDQNFWRGDEFQKNNQLYFRYHQNLTRIPKEKLEVSVATPLIGPNVGCRVALSIFHGAHRYCRHLENYLYIHNHRRYTR